MESFSRWLLGEAGAGWIIGIIGILGGLYAWTRREKAPKIIVQQVRSISLLDVHPSQSGSIRVAYLDPTHEPCGIESLHQTELVVYNTGTKDVVEPIELVITFHRKEATNGSIGENEIGFWKLVFDDVGCKSETLLSNDEEVGQRALMTIPYLNSYSTHGHCVRAYLITEHSVELRLVRGTGKGWSAALYTLDQFADARAKTARLIRYGLLASYVVCSIWLFSTLLQSPVSAALYMPTLKNLDRAIEVLSQQRSAVLAAGVPPIWTRLLGWKETAPTPQAVMAVVVWLIIVFAVGLRGHNAVSAWVASRYLGVETPQHWCAMCEKESPATQ